jgi:hypothetical protein
MQDIKRQANAEHLALAFESLQIQVFQPADSAEWRDDSSFIGVAHWLRFPPITTPLSRQTEAKSSNSSTLAVEHRSR